MNIDKVEEVHISNLKNPRCTKWKCKNLPNWMITTKERNQYVYCDKCIKTFEVI